MKAAIAFLMFIVSFQALAAGSYGRYPTYALAGDNADITSLKATNQIGIGTTSPAAELEIKGKLDQPITGTVSVSAGSTAVVGVLTSFTAEVHVGDVLKIGGEIHSVIAVSDNAHLTLGENQVTLASGVQAFQDRLPFAVYNGSGNQSFSVSRSGALFFAGTLLFTGVLNSGPIISNYSDNYSYTIAGTTTCDGTGACVGTGTAYTTDLAASVAIQDPENAGSFLFVSAVADNTHMTLAAMSDPFGFADATIQTTQDRHSIATFSNNSLGVQGGGFVIDTLNRVQISTGAYGPALEVMNPPVGVALKTDGLTQLGGGGVAFTAMGACAIGSTTITTTAATHTCTGIPASVAVTCTGSAAFSTATANGLYCRASAPDTVACNTTLANTTAMTFACSWVQP